MVAIAVVAKCVIAAFASRTIKAPLIIAVEIAVGSVAGGSAKVMLTAICRTGDHFCFFITCRAVCVMRAFFWHAVVELYRNGFFLLSYLAV